MTQAKVFNFKKKETLKLELNGKIFEVDTSDQKFTENLKKFGLELQNLGSNKEYNLDENIENIDLNKLAKQNEKAMKLFAEGIDKLLGEKATEEIYGDHEVTLENIAELSFFIISEINEYAERKMKEKQKEISNKYSPKRVKR